MHHAVLVREGECARNVPQDVHRVAKREGAFLRQAVAERAPFHQRHGIVGQVSSSSGGEQRNDVRLLQRGDHPDLALEPFQAEAFDQLGCEDLHHDLSSEPRFVGHEHAGHAAAAQLPLECVRVAQCSLEARPDVARIFRQGHAVFYHVHLQTATVGGLAVPCRRVRSARRGQDGAADGSLM